MLLCDLPNEMLCEIFSYLSYEDKCNISSVCSQFHKFNFILNYRSLYKELINEFDELIDDGFNNLEKLRMLYPFTLNFQSDYNMSNNMVYVDYYIINKNNEIDTNVDIHGCNTKKIWKYFKKNYKNASVIISDFKIPTLNILHNTSDDLYKKYVKFNEIVWIPPNILSDPAIIKVMYYLYRGTSYDTRSNKYTLNINKILNKYLRNVDEKDFDFILTKTFKL